MAKLNRLSLKEMSALQRKLTAAQKQEADLIRQRRKIDKDLAELQSFIKKTSKLLDTVVNL